jgi:hypothetical protein
MRRYTFYLSVALLAFGIGFYFVYSYTLRNAEIVSESVRWLDKETVQTVSLNHTQVREKLKTKEYLPDKEKALLLFQLILNKWLSSQKLDDITEPSEEIIRKITESKIDNVDERGLLQSAQKSYKSYLIDVNGDGKDELAVLSNCSPPEYCELWIFKKTKEDFEVILSTYTEVENFSLRKSRTKRYFDIQTTHPYSKSETTLGMAIYKFDGEQYIKEECYDYQHLYKDKNGNLQKIDKPKLIPLHCC